MDKKNLFEMTDEELLVEKKKVMKSKVFFALAIGFCAGILIFGVVASLVSSEKRFGFVIPLLIPIIFIYRMLKNPDTNKDLDEILKKRGLN